ncbi:hypothetical protein CHU_3488 [Cytophaga hutchinsonii ATCC 33406]|uniref:Secretion system C-terminal sorting domain-containing protein n=2 Tax=Cytophaga hutchinsonii TaxID=985 RepID=A0A6N4SW56_CYTH3|nr:hypothetical protein CHU_3488 [Cytophaga hutchinsonii ATCC 33406]SFX70437.1 Por secretion system C-terminal sorting domain-containing protein [Cytophaga hutchinsonii ATCC 33406]
MKIPIIGSLYFLAFENKCYIIRFFMIEILNRKLYEHRVIVILLNIAVFSPLVHTFFRIFINLKIRTVLTLNKLFMKTLLSLFALCMLGICVHAQNVRLRDYTVGEEINDTIFSYYGNLPFSGNGDIYFGGNVTAELMPGVSFKIVIDSINKGESSVNTAFRVEGDENIAIKKGDTVSMPVRLRLFAGKIGFHILVHGTPLTANEEYLCDLVFAQTTSEDWGLVLVDNSNTLCTVDLTTGIKKKLYTKNISVYPNPATGDITLNVAVDMVGFSYNISNAMGRVVTSGNISDAFSVVSVNDLLPGVYYVIVENAAPVKIIKQ